MVADKKFSYFFEFDIKLRSTFGVQKNDTISGNDDANREFIVWFVDEVASGTEKDGLFILFFVWLADVG